MKNFNELGLAEPILRAVSNEGYTQPTPIQAQVIPIMLSGKDLVGIAQTGTGKTAAFVLPLLNRIHARAERPGAKNCSALILAPTRELASQIADSIRTYGKEMRVSVTVVLGGVKPGGQIRALARGTDIVVATPGRLLDHVQTGVIRLDKTETVILDEADQMLDLGFMPTIRKILAKLPKERQTVLLSATMPQQIRGLADDFLNRPAEVSVAPTARPIERIEQSVMHVERDRKRDALVGILRGKDVERVIVFTRTKRGADKVCEFLQKAGINSGAIHGNKSQPQRERTLADFRGSRTKVLVATDIAARGIDVDGISHVINYELPNVPEAYVHRIGRTARAGNSGIAISLCEHSERGLLRDIERLIGNAVQRDDTPDSGKPYNPVTPADRQLATELRPRQERKGTEDDRSEKPRNRSNWKPNKPKKAHRGQSQGKPQGQSQGKSHGQSQGRRQSADAPRQRLAS
ncbi:DEAD/DEAH box helicase [Thalassospiraceae bacterium LMO-JJ14]|nr:DEAD/DEAH box helicase [Thalassospiraceae bacterium LMO-JJ14]